MQTGLQSVRATSRKMPGGHGGQGMARILLSILMRALGGLRMTHRHDRLCALADSLPAAIRWRYCDYEQLLRKQLQIMLAPQVRLVWPPRGFNQTPHCD